MNASASSRVNFPAAWRWVKPIGPRASRKSVWPASSSRASRSCTCLCDAGGPLVCPKAMASVSPLEDAQGAGGGDLVEAAGGEGREVDLLVGRSAAVGGVL